MPKSNVDLALAKARGYAKAGNRWWARYFVQRAESFGYVSDIQKRKLDGWTVAIMAVREDPTTELPTFAVDAARGGAR